MAITLETLLIEFGANFDRFDQELNSASAKAKKKAKEIESIKISPSVDLKSLHDLNDLLDVKIKHIQELRDEAEKGIKVKVGIDDAPGAEFGKTLDTMEKMGQEFASALGSPFKKVFTGVFEGVGQDIGRLAFKGVNTYIKATTNKNIQQYANEAVEKAIDSTLKGNAPTKKYRKTGGGGSSQPDSSGGQITRAERDYTAFNRSADYAAKGALNVAAAFVKAGASMYGVAKGTEKVVLDLIPLGHQAKAIAQVVGTAGATAYIGAHVAPVGMALSAGGAGISGLIQAGAGMLPAASGLSQLPIIGGGIAGAGAGLADLAGSAAALYLGGKAATNVAGGAVKALLPSGTEQAVRSASKATEGLAKETSAYLNRVKEVGDKFKGAQQQLKVLSGDKQRQLALASTTYALGSRARTEIAGLLPGAPNEEKQAIKSRMGNIAKAQKAAGNILKKAGINPDDVLADFDFKGLELKARKAAQSVGGFVAKGIGKGIKDDKEVELVLAEFVDEMDETLRRSAGIKSPARRFIPIGQYIAQGISKGFKAAMGHFMGKDIDEEVEKAQEIGEKAAKKKDNSYSAQVARAKANADRLYQKGGKKFQERAFGDTGMEGQAMGRNAFGMLAATSAAVAPQTSLMAAGLAPLAFSIAPTVLGVTAALSMIRQPLQQARDAIRDIENTTAKMNAIGIAGVSGEEELGYLTKLANKYSTSILSMTDAYTQLQVASKGTRLEGEGIRELFEGITASTKALRLNQEDSRLVFLAYTQILSKGKLSMEELRQQLGEKFSPAMNVFAKALGVSNAELTSQISKGGILAEEVLPKVAKVLMKDYGKAALSGADDFTSAMNRSETALFELNKNLVKTFGGMFAAWQNFNTGIVKLINNNFSTIRDVTASAMIGVAATIGVGTQVILSNPGVSAGLAKVQGTILSTFGRTMTLLSPMMIGMLADVVDGWLGAEDSVMGNMSKGIGNMFVGAIGGLDAIKRQFSSDGQGLFTVDWEEQKSAFAGVTDAFKGLFSLLKPGMVEFAALILMFEQTSVLAKLYLQPGLQGLWTSLKGVAKGFKDAFLSGGSFKNILAELFSGSGMAKAGMMALSLGIKAFAAVAVLSFAKGDFTNPLVDGIQKAAGQIKNEIKGIQDALNSLKPPSQKDVLPDVTAGALPSKGAELNIAKLFGLSNDSFKTDDLQVWWRNNMVEARDQPSDSFLKLQKYGLGNYVPNHIPNEESLTLAERQLVDFVTEAELLQKNLGKQLAAQGLGKGAKVSPDVKKAVDELKRIDAEMLALTQKRSKVAAKGDSGSVFELKGIDDKYEDLLKSRKKAAEPLRDIVTAVGGVSSKMQELNNTIDQSDYDAVLKDKLKEKLIKPIQDIIAGAEGGVANSGLVLAMKEVGEPWMVAYNALKDAELQFEKTKSAASVASNDLQTKIYKAGGSQAGINEKLKSASIETQKEDLARLTSIYNQRKDTLTQMLAIPRVENNDQRKTDIKQLTDQVRQDEDAISQARLSLAQAEYQHVQDQISRQKEIQGFNRSRQDLETSIQQASRERDRAISDMAMAWGEFVNSQARGARDMVENFEGFMKDLETNLIKQAAEIKKLKTSTAITNFYTELREGLSGGGGIISGIFDYFEKVDRRKADHAASIEGLALTALDHEKQRTETAKQIRQLGEAQYDFEKDRFNQLIGLGRNQEDFVTNQRQQWTGITRQVEDMEAQAKQMGLNFQGIVSNVGSIADALADAANKFNAFTSELSLGQISSSGGGFSGAGTLVGISGNSGGSTGAHIDARIKGGSRRLTNEELSRFEVGGKNLTGYRITSEYGMRTHPIHGDRRMHKGVDLAVPAGLEIKTIKPAKVSKPYYDKKGGGWITDVTFEDGVTVQLLHQDPSVTKRNLGGTSSTMSSGSSNRFARLVAAEAGGEDILGQALVALSVKNRQAMISQGKVKPGHYNAKSGSLDDIINARGQYEPVSSGAINKSFSKGMLDKAEQAIALANDPQKLRAMLAQKGLAPAAINKLMTSTGFRTHTAFNDPSQNYNKVRYGGHAFNGDFASVKGFKMPSGSTTIQAGAVEIKAPTFKAPSIVDAKKAEKLSKQFNLAPVPKLNIGAATDLANQQTTQNQELTQEQKNQLEADNRRKAEEERREAINLRNTALDGIRALNKEDRERLESAQELLMNSKGYLTIQEDIAKAGSDVSKQYRNQVEAIDESIIKLKRELDGGQAQIDALKGRNDLTQEQKDYLATIENLVAETNQSLEEQLAIKNQLVGAEQSAVSAATERARIEKELAKSGFETDFESKYLNAKSKNADPFTAIGLKNQASKLGIEQDYKKESLALEDFIKQNNIAAEAAAKMRGQLSEMRDMNLSDTFMQNNEFAGMFGDTLKGIFTDIRNVGDALKNLATRLLDMAATWASNTLMRALFGGGGGTGSGIGGFLGGLFGGGGGGGNMLPPTSTVSGGGGGFGGILGTVLQGALGLFGGGGFTGATIAAPVGLFRYGGTVGNYAMGGTVGNYALGGAIGDAMKRENHPYAMPIVAHKGEEVLSTLNGDAQFYRAMKRRGSWNELKMNGRGNPVSGVMPGARIARSGGFSNNTVINVTTPDAASFHRSKSQIMLDSESRSRRAYERNK